MVFQSAATLAVVFATASVCQTQPWWTGRLLDPFHVQVQLATVAAWCFLWSVGRILFRRRFASFVRRMRLAEFAVDELVLGASLLALLGTVVVACVPGIAQELTIRLSPTVMDPAKAQAFLAYGSWIALALIALATAASLVESRTLTKVAGLLLVAATAATLAGGFGYKSFAVASTLRSSFAGLGGVLTIGLLVASRFDAPLRRFLPGRSAASFATYEALCRDWTLALAAVLIVGLTTLSLIQAADGVVPSGPSPESLFARMGAELSFGVPLGLLVTIFVAHALRAKNPQLMVAGSLAFQYLVNLAYFLPILKSGDASWNWPIVIGCLQWNSLGFAAFALLWLGLRRFIEPKQSLFRVSGTEGLLALQVFAAVGAAVAISALAVSATIASPDDLTSFRPLGGWASFVACIASFGALAWMTRARMNAVGVSVVIGALVALCGPLAIAFEGQAGNWGAFHTLTIAWLSAAAVSLAITWIARLNVADKRIYRIAIGWTSALLVASILLALRGAPFDPAAPWSSFGALLATTALATSLGFRTRLHTFAYASAFTACAAITIVWAYVWPTGGVQSVVDLLQLDVLALLAISIVWLLAEIREQKLHSRDFFLLSLRWDLNPRLQAKPSGFTFGG
jgi:hypothetical protein